jgi:fatty-acyl-CoA synthase
VVSDESNERLFNFLQRAPGAGTAIIHDGRSLTYGALRETAIGAANSLFALGLKQGDRVAVMVPNSTYWLAINFGAALLGVAVVSLNIRLGPKEVGDLIARTSAKALIYDPVVLHGVCVATLRAVDPNSLLSLIGVVRVGESKDRFELPGAANMELLALLQMEGRRGEPRFTWTGVGSDPCLIMATSGTTGRPKIVVHLQERVARHMTSVAQAAGLIEPSAKSLVVMPFGGAFGYTLLMSALAGGQAVVIAEGFDPTRTADLIRAEQITHMGGTNDMLYKMLQADSRPDPFPSLRAYFHANFTPSLVEMPLEAERRHVLIRGAYGQSELLALAALQRSDADLEQRSEGGGQLVDLGATFRIVDPDTDQLMNDGEVGEIQIQTPNAMWGYLEDPDATAAVFTKDGFVRTGDLGRRISDSELVFDTRRNDVLRIGGYLVSPAEIEDVILANDQIVACQVVAVAQPAGVRPVAFVVAGPGADDEKTLIDRCRSKLAKYKVPIRIFYVEDFPSVDGPNGKKVKRDELRDLAKRMLTAEVT